MVVPGNTCCCRTGSKVSSVSLRQERFTCGGVNAAEHPKIGDRSGACVVGRFGFRDQRLVYLDDVARATNQRCISLVQLMQRSRCKLNQLGRVWTVLRPSSCPHVAERPEGYLHRNIHFAFT